MTSRPNIKSGVVMGFFREDLWCEGFGGRAVRDLYETQGNRMAWEFWVFCRYYIATWSRSKDHMQNLKPAEMAFHVHSLAFRVLLNHLARRRTLESAAIRSSSLNDTWISGSDEKRPVMHDNLP